MTFSFFLDSSASSNPDQVRDVQLTHRNQKHHKKTEKPKQKKREKGKHSNQNQQKKSKNPLSAHTTPMPHINSILVLVDILAPSHLLHTPGKDVKEKKPPNH